MSVKELSSSMCAFANTEGESIYVGVTDSVRLAGIKVTTESLDRIQNSAREECSPPVQITLSELPLPSKKSIIKIEIKQSSHLHSIAKGYTYIRIGTQDKKVIGDQLLRLAETKSMASFEDHLLEVGMEAIDLAEVSKYIEARQTREKLSEKELLLKLGLAKIVDDEFCLTAGGFVLFGKKDSQELLQRDFQFVVYGSSSMYTFREELAISAPNIPDRILELLRPYNRSVAGVKGVKRVEEFAYPEIAIREAVLNAIAHRDYRIAGLKNEFRVYDNRVEVISAGKLPPIINLENIEERHYSRNPKIMHALMIYGLVEELGQGVKLMKESLIENNNPPLEFHESLDQFKIVFYKRRSERVGTSVDAVLNCFVKGEEIRRGKIELLTGLSSTSTKNIIRKLIKSSKIEKIGNGPATRYKKK